VLSFFHYFSCVFDFESWAVSVQTGQPVLKSSIPGASFSPSAVVILDPIENTRNAFSNFVVETADSMRVELYRVFQVNFLRYISRMPSFFQQLARHTSRILPLSGEALEESLVSSSASSIQCAPVPSLDAGMANFAPASVVASSSSSNAQDMGVLETASQFGSNQIPSHVLAELQVCLALCEITVQL
jgi:hypothetical protein